MKFYKSNLINRRIRTALLRKQFYLSYVNKITRHNKYIAFFFNYRRNELLKLCKVNNIFCTYITSKVGCLLNKKLKIQLVDQFMISTNDLQKYLSFCLYILKWFPLLGISFFLEGYTFNLNQFTEAHLQYFYCILREHNFNKNLMNFSILLLLIKTFLYFCLFLKHMFKLLIIKLNLLVHSFEVIKKKKI